MCFDILHTNITFFCALNLTIFFIINEDSVSAFYFSNRHYLSPSNFLYLCTLFLAFLSASESLVLRAEPTSRLAFISSFTSLSFLGPLGKFETLYFLPLKVLYRLTSSFFSLQ